MYASLTILLYIKDLSQNLFNLEKKTDCRKYLSGFDGKAEFGYARDLKNELHLDKMTKL